MAASSKPIAGDGVADGQRDEREGNGQHEDVQHRVLLAANTAALNSWRDSVRRKESRSVQATIICQRSHRNSRGTREQRYKNLIKIAGGTGSEGRAQASHNPDPTCNEPRYRKVGPLRRCVRDRLPETCPKKCRLAAAV